MAWWILRCVDQDVSHGLGAQRLWAQLLPNGRDLADGTEPRLRIGVGGQWKDIQGEVRVTPRTVVDSLL